MTIESITNACATYQPDTKSNPNPNPSRNSTTKQHAIVNIQQRMYPDKFIRDDAVSPFLLFSIAILSHCRNTFG